MPGIPTNTVTIQYCYDRQKQPAPLVANTPVNTNWHHVTFFHPFHFMFYTWVQVAAIHQARVAQSDISYMQLRGISHNLLPWYISCVKEEADMKKIYGCGVGTGWGSVFLFVWSEMWKSFDNKQSRKRDAHSLHNWRTYCKGGSTTETRDNFGSNFPEPEESVSWFRVKQEWESLQLQGD